MSATLDQIISSLGSIYQPQLDNVQAQQAQLPQQLQNDEQALQGQQTQAFDGILNSARRRGTGVAFGGIPLGEQAQYNATTYMPAAANLRSTYAQKGTSLQDAISKINENRFNQANGMYQFGVQQDNQQQQFAEQQRQFNEQQAASARTAASANSFNPTYGGTSSQAPVANQPQFIGNNDLRGHLSYQATKLGNKDAAVALKYVGNDGKYKLDPKTTDPNVIAALNRLGATNTFKSPITVSGSGTPTNVFNSTKPTYGVPITISGSLR